MFNESLVNQERRKNAAIIKDIQLLGDILLLYQGVLNAIHGISSSDIRKRLEDYVTS